MKLALFTAAVLLETLGVGYADPIALSGKPDTAPAAKAAPADYYQHEAAAKKKNCTATACLVSLPTPPAGKIIRVTSVSCLVVASKSTKSLFGYTSRSGLFVSDIQGSFILETKFLGLGGDNIRYYSASSTAIYLTDDPSFSFQAAPGEITAASCSVSGTLINS